MSKIDAMKARLASIVTALLVVVCATHAGAAVIQVPLEFATIQGAILSASDNDEIVVGPGNYAESIDFLGKAILVRSAQGAEVTVIDAGGTGSAAVFQNGEGLDSILEGFTLTGGVGSSLGIPTFGGGVLIVGSSPTVRDCIIESNKANFGGGIACLEDSLPRIERNVIQRNRGTLDDPENVLGLGGGIFCSGRSSAEILANRIEDNVSDFRGGGIYLEDDSQAFVEENHLEGNETLVEGGGLAAMSGSDFLSLRNVFVANYSEFRGGGVHVEQATMLSSEDRFTANTCGLHGAGISMATGTDDSRIERARFDGNIAEGGGGAIYVINTKPTLLGNVYIGNASLCTEGSCGGGALFAASGGKPTCVNETYYGNTSALGGGAVFSFGLSRPSLINAILWNNSGENDAEIGVDIASVFVSSCIVRGGWDGTNVLDADPLFVNAEAGDLHLRLGSPAVDAGQTGHEDLPELDFDGGDRVVNGDAGPVAQVDLGADELRPEIAALFGSVGDAAGSVKSVLTLNGSAGDVERRVRIAVREGLVIDMAAPDAGPQPAPFVLYVFEGAPDLATLTPLPSGVGVMGFALPFLGGNPRVVWNNVGHEPMLGSPSFPSLPAPSRVVDAPRGVGFGVTVTVQGIILDDGSAADVPASVTNGVVLEVVTP